MCKSAGVPVSRIFRVCIASNTTMNHLLLGVDANPVRMEPYIPTFFQWRGMTAKDLGFPANPDAEILLAPNIGSYVGGDITAGAFTSLHLGQGRVLAVHRPRHQRRAGLRQPRLS